MKRSTIFAISLITFLMSSCTKSNDGINLNQERDVILDAELYSTHENNHAQLEVISISENSIEIEYGWSGCDGNSFVPRLFGVQSDDTAFPPTINVLLHVESTELCEAYIFKKETFNLENFQLDNTDVVQLRFVKPDTTVLYRY